MDSDSRMDNAISYIGAGAAVATCVIMCYQIWIQQRPQVKQDFQVVRQWLLRFFGFKWLNTIIAFGVLASVLIKLMTIHWPLTHSDLVGIVIGVLTFQFSLTMAVITLLYRETAAIYNMIHEIPRG